MRDELVLIRITETTRDAIKTLAEQKGLKQITVLEYLLSGKIKLSELKDSYWQRAIIGVYW